MNSFKLAQERVKILNELLKLTPDPEIEYPPLANLQEMLIQRQELFDQLPEPPRDAEDVQNLELAQLNIEANDLVRKIISRDKKIIENLKHSRQNLAGTLQQLSKRHSPPKNRNTVLHKVG